MDSGLYVAEVSLPDNRLDPIRGSEPSSRTRGRWGELDCTICV